MSPKTMPHRHPPKTRVELVWFKRDLRVADHRPLSMAAQSGPVLPLFVVEPDLWQQPDMSGRQFAFLQDCLHVLQSDLAELGQPLVIRVGDVVEVFSALAQTFQIAAIWSHEETGNAWTYARDKRVAAWCAANGIVWKEYRQDGVVRRLQSRNGWAKRWDQTMASDPARPPPGLQALDIETRAAQTLDGAAIGIASDPCPQRQAGGRGAAVATLDSFLTERGRTYRRAMSSPALGATACSRMSAHLAWGTMSLREVTQRTWQRQRASRSQPGPHHSQWRDALISFNGRLHWHCHFMQKLEDEPRLEFTNMHPAYDAIRRPAETDRARLAAWQAGETGLPFVDACMRCLNATGWLNFRMRAMLMAVASYHLWLDWRSSGEHLARQFTDYEAGIHWPQVQMQSGTTGINTVRIYNPIKQGYDQDPQGDFVRTWVPELASVAGPSVHEPWKHPHAQGLLGRAYPQPIVDHSEAARAARQTIYGLRRSDDFRQTADNIQSKHGSRKSGIAHTGQRKSGQPKSGQGKSSAARPSRGAHKVAEQLAFDIDQPADASPALSPLTSPTRLKG